MMHPRELHAIREACASEETTAAELRRIIRRLLREVEMWERLVRKPKGRVGVN